MMSGVVQLFDDYPDLIASSHRQQSIARQIPISNSQISNNRGDGTLWDFFFWSSGSAWSLVFEPFTSMQFRFDSLMLGDQRDDT